MNNFGVDGCVSRSFQKLLSPANSAGDSDAAKIPPELVQLSITNSIVSSIVSTGVVHTARLARWTEEDLRAFATMLARYNDDQEA